MEILWFMTFHTQILWVQNHYVFGSKKIVGLNTIYDGVIYLKLFGPESYDAIYNRTRYLISEKSGIADIINHNFARIRIDSYNSLPIKKHLLMWLLIMW